MKSKIRLALAFTALVLLVVLFYELPVTAWLIAASDWLKSQGVQGAIVVCLAEVIWIALCLPSTPIELLIGSTYGFGWGYVVDSIGKSTGCMCAFAIGRSVGREPVSRWLERSYASGGGRAHRLLRALDVAIATQGWRIVLPFQLAYVPIALKNYGLSVCELRWQTFAWTMLLAEAPMTAAAVYAGSTARSLMDLLDPGHNSRGGGSGGGGSGGGGGSSSATATLVAAAVGGAFVVVTLAVVGVYVRRALLQLEVEEGEGGDGDAVVLLQQLQPGVEQPSARGSGSVQGHVQGDSYSQHHQCMQSPGEAEGEGEGGGEQPPGAIAPYVLLSREGGRCSDV